MQSFFSALPKTDEKTHFEIKRLGKMGLTNDEISKELNINKAYVDHILLDKMYTHNLYDDDDSFYKDKIESFSPENAEKMARIGATDRIRARYLNKLRMSGLLTLGGRRTNKNKKKYNKLSRRRHRRDRYNKKNRKSMKRK
jgi:hypothetical protein